jgi:hypothetical protein
MRDREMLDMLATEAPVPQVGYGGDVLKLARRARRRRRVTAWGAGLGVVAVTLVTAALLAPSATTQPGAPTGQTMQPASASPTPNQARAAEAQAYAAAVRALADQVREGGAPWPVLYVLDHTCANVVTPGPGTCDPQSLPASVRSDLTVALASYAPVQFVANGADVTDPELVVVNGGVVVTLGRIQLHDDKAQVPLSVRRNGLNGRGLTYQLTREAATWRVEGTVGPAWIS